MSLLKPLSRPSRQRGAIAVLVGVAIVGLVMMAGLVVDLGRLYVVKTELQNAADACALAAARELNDRSEGATGRSKNAAISVGTLNKVGLQSDAVVITETDIHFSNRLEEAAWTDTVQDDSVYAWCTPHAASVNLLFMQAGRLLGLASPDAIALSADAVARMMNSQSFCAIPLAMCTTESASTGFGFEMGKWYTGRLTAGNGITGMYGWIQFGGPGAAEVAEALAGPGLCDVRPTHVDAKSGEGQGIAKGWNTRFGLYAGPFSNITLYPPDRTGWAYSPTRSVLQGHTTVTIPGNWPPSDAAGEIDFGTPANPRNAYYDYLAKKDGFVPYDPNNVLEANGHTANFPGNPGPLRSDDHQAHGQDRRLALAPIIRCADWTPTGKNMEVLDWACALMLSPINDPDTDVRLEFRGLASAGACGSTGAPGNFGPLVPALVK
ncbi:MAG TPA: pilus assembly protein TadG-related protein [Ramlibacter sp.]|uniref:TadE/TadG family type IV pilus assembly protein n=1 Tax=Ramlibacter sp. TaxID=1917967 RepID=UPI002D7F21DD|nr:pilus assembly protein TadG-related protein [Ramlibacter sp.]HET8746397.1 pilus assembly protein TadG-related protein [Ramlibacter sp.]